MSTKEDALNLHSRTALNQFALKLVDKVLEDIRIVVVGAGSAGYGIVKILIKAGIRDIVVLDSKGALFEGRTDLNSINDPFKCELAKITNKGCKKGVPRSYIRKRCSNRRFW